MSPVVASAMAAPAVRPTALTGPTGVTRRTAAAGTIRRAVVIGGAGAVGSLFVRSLTGWGIQVAVLDRPDDVLALDDAALAEIACAHAVVLALPETVAIRALPQLLPALAPGAVLVDTLSVKGPYAAAFDAARDRTGTDAVQAVGLNPMFAPALGFPGRPVAAVVLQDGDRAAEVLRLVDAWGARVVVTDADRHDRLCAATQALTHAAVLAFGGALTRLDVSLDEIVELAPPPHAALLGLLARILGQAPEVYWDVQAANPHAANARETLIGEMRRLSATVLLDDERSFGHLLGDARGFFGERLPDHQSACAQVFDALAATPSPTGAAPRAAAG